MALLCQFCVWNRIYITGGGDVMVRCGGAVRQVIGCEV